MNKTTVVNTLVSAVGGAVIGGGITFLTVKKHFQKKADAEVEEVKRHYALVRKDATTIDIFSGVVPNEDPNESTPLSSVNDKIPGTPEQYAKAKALIDKMGYDTTTINNVFDSPVPDSVVGPELTGPNGQPVAEYEGDSNDPMANYVRLSGEPYIISRHDFFDTEEDWEKSSLSYYQGDDTLVDEREQQVDDREKYIGGRHLEMFGVLSDDKRVVYVRNAQISTDFEIVLEQGKFSVFLGADDSDEEPKTQIRRMRDRD